MCIPFLLHSINSPRSSAAQPITICVIRKYFQGLVFSLFCQKEAYLKEHREYTRRIIIMNTTNVINNNSNVW